MADQVSNLYKEIILQRNQSPFNYEKRESATYQVDAYNPTCGDHFTLYVDLNAETIQKISFHGYGCAISKASTSILTELTCGKTIEEALSIENMLGAVLNGKGDKHIHPKELLAFEPVLSHPGRRKCVTLAWDVFSEFLSKI